MALHVRTISRQVIKSPHKTYQDTQRERERERERERGEKVRNDDDAVNYQQEEGVMLTRVTVLTHKSLGTREQNLLSSNKKSTKTPG